MYIYTASTHIRARARTCVSVSGQDLFLLNQHFDCTWKSGIACQLFCVLQYAGARKCRPSVDKCKHETLKLYSQELTGCQLLCYSFLHFFGIAVYQKRKKEKQEKKKSCPVCCPVSQAICFLICFHLPFIFIFIISSRFYLISAFIFLLTTSISYTPSHNNKCHVRQSASLHITNAINCMLCPRHQLINPHHNTPDFSLTHFISC